jgi:hypothetical protein
MDCAQPWTRQKGGEHPLNSAEHSPLRRLFDVVSWARIVRQANNSSKAIQAVSNRNVNRFTKDAVPGALKLTAKPHNKAIPHQMVPYRPAEYEITCVFPPLTYSTTGFTLPVTTRPISMSANNTGNHAETSRAPNAFQVRTPNAVVHAHKRFVPQQGKCSCTNRARLQWRTHARPLGETNHIDVTWR